MVGNHGQKDTLIEQNSEEIRQTILATLLSELYVGGMACHGLDFDFLIELHLLITP